MNNVNKTKPIAASFINTIKVLCTNVDPKLDRGST